MLPSVWARAHIGRILIVPRALWTSNHVEPDAELAHPAGGLYRRDPRAGPGAGRGARRQLRGRPLVEHGKPRIAYLREQRRAAVEPQRHPASPAVAATRLCPR